MRKRTQKGFTIVELVIVIAVIAILAAVLIPTFASIIDKANNSADTQMVANINKYLASVEEIDGKNATMSDALLDIVDAGYNATALMNATNTILWDSESDRVMAVNGSKTVASADGAKYSTKDTSGKYWIVASEYNSETNYSYYLTANAVAQMPTEVKYGLDISAWTFENVEAMPTVTYTGTGANVVFNGEFKAITVNCGAVSGSSENAGNNNIVSKLALSENTETGTNGKVRLYGFVGELTLTKGNLEVNGFVSKLTFTDGSLTAGKNAQFHEKQEEINSSAQGKTFTDNGAKYEQHYFGVNGELASCLSCSDGINPNHTCKLDIVTKEEDGKTYLVVECSICHKEYGDRNEIGGNTTGQKCNHANSETKSAEAQCVVPGYTLRYCKDCGEQLEFTETAATGHTEQTLKAVAATCTDAGLTEGKECSVCEAILVKQESVPAKGHTAVTDAAVDPTCTATGLTQGSHCSVCDAVLIAQNTIDAKGHTNVIDAAVAATCTATGLTEGKHCSVCNAVLVAQETVAAKGHTEEDVAAVAATCTTDGFTKGVKCSVCGEILTAQDTIPATGHKEVIDVAVAATCVKSGLSEGKHCAVCNEVLVAQNTVAAKGHTKVVDKVVMPTCGKTGLTEGSHCSVCGTVLEEQNTIAATGEHIFGRSIADNYKCLNCDEAHRDVTHIDNNIIAWFFTTEPVKGSAGIPVYLNEYAIHTDTIVFGFKADYIDDILASDSYEKIPCKYDDVEIYAVRKDNARKDCLDTRDYLLDVYVLSDKVMCFDNAADGHQLFAGFGLSLDWDVHGAVSEVRLENFDTANATDLQQMFGFCVIENVVIGENFVINTKVDVFTVFGVNADKYGNPQYDKDGNLSYSYGIRNVTYPEHWDDTYPKAMLTTEGEWPSEGVKYEHNDLVIDPAVAPTCTETGLTAGSHCAICGAVVVKQEVISAKGHTEVVDKAVVPTCTKTGLTEGKHCSVCNEVLVKQDTVSATGHTTVIDQNKAPTCTETGLTAGSHCSVCKEVLTKQEIIPAKGHTEAKKDAVAPTCTKTGLTEGKYCAVCNEILVKQETVKATGEHTYNVLLTKGKDATCTAAGVEDTYKCATCGATTGGKEIKALGHDKKVVTEAKAATCTEDGNEAEYKCSRCDWHEGGQTITKLGHNFSKSANDSYKCLNGCGECRSTTRIDNHIIAGLTRAEEQPEENKTYWDIGDTAYYTNKIVFGFREDYIETILTSGEFSKISSVGYENVEIYIVKKANQSKGEIDHREYVYELYVLSDSVMCFDNVYSDIGLFTGYGVAIENKEGAIPEAAVQHILLENFDTQGSTSIDHIFMWCQVRFVKFGDGFIVSDTVDGANLIFNMAIIGSVEYPDGYTGPKAELSDNWN